MEREGWRRRIASWVVSGGFSTRASLVAVLVWYSFASQFLPIEPYLVPYLISVKHFSNFQVTVDIFPISVYAQLVFTLLMAPACYYLSHKLVIILGAFGMLVSYVIVWAGQSLLAMQIMQITYAFGMSARIVFSSHIFALVPEEEYQSMTSLTTMASLLSFVLASELSQFLAIEEVSYDIFFVISLTALGVCCVVSFLLPKDRSLHSSSLTNLWDQKVEWISVLKETWNSQNLKTLSLWWALTFAGSSLVQNYSTNLFDAVDTESKYNGHILAAAEAVGSIGSYSAVYIENFAAKLGTSIYVLGSALMGIQCACMGMSTNIWAVYISYVMLFGTYQTLACLVNVRCGRLLSNGQFILLFSINGFAGLLIETLLQAVVEISGLTIFAQFMSFAGFFFLTTAIFIGLCCLNCGKSKPISYLVSETEPQDSLLCST